MRIIIVICYHSYSFSQHIHNKLVLSLTMTPPPSPSIEELTTILNQLLHSQQSFHASVSANNNTLTSKFYDLRSQIPPLEITSSFTPQGLDIHSFPTITMKLYIPHLNDSDPLGQIFKINQFLTIISHLRISDYAQKPSTWKAKLQLGFNACTTMAHF